MADAPWYLREDDIIRYLGGRQPSSWCNFVTTMVAIRMMLDIGALDLDIKEVLPEQHLD